ncbi:exported protein of unknown function [Streptantibioticus cattleyicolor NRRL 8057 = DSM 46488]|nr:exported protein of unknown function [Streptantibioticus cattleyicolor NRRL 8057 = DSM 46488]
MRTVKPLLAVTVGTVGLAAVMGAAVACDSTATGPHHSTVVVVHHDTHVHVVSPVPRRAPATRHTTTVIRRSTVSITKRR